MSFCYDEIAKLFNAEAYPLLHQHLKSVRLKRGEHALVQGHQSPGLWYISKGSCHVTVQSPGDRGSTELNPLAKGSVFGEIAFIDQSQATATVTAKGPCECLVLPHAILPALEMLEPHTAFEIISAISCLSSQRIRYIMGEINKKWRSQMVLLKIKPRKTKPTAVKDIRSLINEACFHMMPEFDDYSEEEIETLCRTMPCYEYEKNSILFEEHQESHVPYCVLRGSVQTFFKQRNKLGKLSVIGPGRMVGLTSYVDHKDRPSSAMAREHSLLMAFTPEGFEKLERKNHDLFNKLTIDLHKTHTRGYRSFLMHLLQAQSIKYLT